MSNVLFSLLSHYHVYHVSSGSTYQ